MKTWRVLPLVFVAACTQQELATETPQSMMVRVAKQAQACWFKRKDPTFQGYKMASELNSHSGRPRILIVPGNRPTDLPKLVAQAERRGGETAFSAFGPLLDGPEGQRLRASLSRWAGGSAQC